MANTIKAFDFEIDGSGARVVTAKTPLHASCMSAGEIDANIKLLKQDLDAVAQRMKEAIRRDANKLQELD